MEYRASSALVLACLALPAHAVDDHVLVKSLSYCLALATTLEQEATDKAFARRWTAASARYAVPLLELVPSIEERRARTEAAMKEVEERGASLRDSKHLLAGAYESIRTSFDDCNSKLKAYEARSAVPPGPPASPAAR